MIVSHPFPPEARKISVDPGAWCSIYEAQWLIWMSQKTTGSILEIGTHYGGTTRNLARANPDKIIYTVDWVTDTPTMREEQRATDMPTLENVGNSHKESRTSSRFSRTRGTLTTPERTSGSCSSMRPQLRRRQGRHRTRHQIIPGRTQTIDHRLARLRPRRSAGMGRDSEVHQGTR